MHHSQEKNGPTTSGIGSSAKTLISFLVVGHLGMVLLGPLSVPIASEDLTLPLAKAVSPYHRALFLGHGYRFFGPDPGPSHIVEYTVRKQDGTTVDGRFPDSDTHWPRLRYHRWFMFSETFYEDVSSLPSPTEQVKLIDEMEQEIEFYRIKGELASANQLIHQRDQVVNDYETNNQRVSILKQHLADYLLQLHDGDSVEIRLLERLIPRPVDVRSRVKLTDSRYLSEPKSLGQFLPTKQNGTAKE